MLLRVKADNESCDDSMYTHNHKPTSSIHGMLTIAPQGLITHLHDAPVPSPGKCYSFIWIAPLVTSALLFPFVPLLLFSTFSYSHRPRLLLPLHAHSTFTLLPFLNSRPALVACFRYTFSRSFSQTLVGACALLSR